MSSLVIFENIQYFKNLKAINLNCKDGNKIDNKIEDSGCTAIFSNARSMSRLERLSLYGNKE